MFSTFFAAVLVWGCRGWNTISLATPGFFSNCSGRARAWIREVLHQKKGQVDEFGVVHWTLRVCGGALVCPSREELGDVSS